MLICSIFPSIIRPTCAECRSLQYGEVHLPDHFVPSPRRRHDLADTHRVAAFAPLYLQLQVLGVLDVIPRARTGQLLCTLHARCESSTRSL
jgi:hypothetical protein